MAEGQDQPYSAIENQVMDALEKVIDPELGIDLVNLGLIYDVRVDDQGTCTVTMTLTTMGCPLGDILNRDITSAVLSVDGVDDCKINLVWEPAWDISRMSRFAKIALGIHG
ncbi:MULTISPECIES: metal-sulfur cluster assembly factor [Limosilactobacillus]|jgi:metal-sulfur cluster biosynthetic enzyme|uniref:metal-sulfur cluster assembly factor n=1 Tax=Limosilactobacillus TaxID=2742598 RepID=UPI002263CAC4|nr:MULTISPECIES: metal-sulfur cluster assembly factor [Limosilactobacillus]MCH3922762.1 metal-sulfur cluster assembly factor [Limosilactobacillus sp.]MCH3927445.1 metal-sulfur cluster assembly factor [Limosilactobacillus sp.]